MNIFDKVYVISYVKNIEKQIKIKSVLNKLNISNFEYIYGIDMHISNICETLIYDERDGKTFIINDNIPESYCSHAISCGIAHLTALQHAYYSGLENCLIIEDDVLLYKNLEYVNNVLYNYPKNADVVQFGYILWENEFNKKYDDYFNIGMWHAGAQAYAICNRNALKKIIDKYLQIFYEADNYNLFSNLIIYNTNIPIFLDPMHKAPSIDISNYN